MKVGSTFKISFSVMIETLSKLLIFTFGKSSVGTRDTSSDATTLSSFTFNVFSLSYALISITRLSSTGFSKSTLSEVGLSFMVV